MTLKLFEQIVERNGDSANAIVMHIMHTNAVSSGNLSKQIIGWKDDEIKELKEQIEELEDHLARITRKVEGLLA